MLCHLPIKKLICRKVPIVKTASFLSNALEVRKTKAMGRGVFTIVDLRANELIEIAPVLVMSGEDRFHLDQTLLHDYIFEWGPKGDQCCMALGYVPLYNHSYKSNCEYEMNFRQHTISVRTVRKIRAGEELFINYNGDWNNSKPIWFEVK